MSKVSIGRRSEKNGVLFFKIAFERLDFVYTLILNFMVSFVNARPTADGRVRINVGGKIFEAHISDLRRSHSAVLSHIIDDSKNQRELFLDRNPALFEKILDYLRDDKNFIPPTDDDVRELLAKEAEYYDVNGLLKMCSSDFKEGDKVQWTESVIESYSDFLMKYWLPKHADPSPYPTRGQRDLNKCEKCHYDFVQRYTGGELQSNELDLRDYVRLLHLEHLLVEKGEIVSAGETFCKVKWPDKSTNVPKAVLRHAH
ncbi:unnamed protein product [Cylicostephanus goldi]|uniref:BTB domain-containing protein n=1 Tax=Cylicostephanus goldi TaxID=71465 RepID=A0A3P6QIE8_CYLGO|nr:unnamed protein product [Cylicostephanus goldi]